MDECPAERVHDRQPFIQDGESGIGGKDNKGKSVISHDRIGRTETLCMSTGVIYYLLRR